MDLRREEIDGGRDGYAANAGVLRGKKGKRLAWALRCMGNAREVTALFDLDVS